MTYYDNFQREAGRKGWEAHFKDLQKAYKKRDKKAILNLYDKEKEMDWNLCPGSEINKNSLSMKIDRLISKCNDVLYDI